MWKSSHLSGESPTLVLEFEKSKPGYCHDMAWLPMPMSGRGMPPDPGGHTTLAKDDPRFVPPSRHLPSKVEEPLDATQDCLFPVPVLTASYHDPDAAAILKLHKLEPWPGYVTHKENILMLPPS